LKKLSVFLVLLSLFLLSACVDKPFGHYEADKMIGTVQNVETDKNFLEVDISEWHKRDLTGDIPDYGVSITVNVTDDIVIKEEDGTSSDIYQIQIGQKVLVNPPKKDNDEDYVVKEIILLDQTNDLTIGYDSYPTVSAVRISDCGFYL
jgi:hypothetical protein